MGFILKMTECKPSSSAQSKSKLGLVRTKHFGLLHCKNECDRKTFVSFEDAALREKIRELQSSHALEALQELFAAESEGMDDNSTSSSVVELLEDGVHADPKKAEITPAPTVAKTPLAAKPAPRIEVPSDPCKDE